MNKAQKHVFAALKYIRYQLLFPLRGIDSDNGSEFINDHLLRYCRDENLVFARSRPNRKTLVKNERRKPFSSTFILDAANLFSNTFYFDAIRMMPHSNQ